MGFFDSIGEALSGAVGDIASAAIGGGLSFLGTSSANSSNQAIANQTTQANAVEAQKNRDFQERMRATQYQTAVQDLQSAGLNPMLAYSQGGAGTPSGAVGYAAQAAPMQNAFQGVGQAISNVKPSEISQRVASTKLASEQEKLANANTAATEALAVKTTQEAKTNAAQELINLGQLKVQKAQIAASNAQAARDVAQAKAIIEDTQKRTAMGNLWNVASDVTSAVRSKFQNLKEYSQRNHTAESIRNDVRSVFGGNK